MFFSVCCIHVNAKLISSCRLFLGNLNVFKQYLLPIDLKGSINSIGGPKRKRVEARRTIRIYKQFLKCIIRTILLCIII